MRRREFIGGIGATAAWPRAACAQQPAMPVVGYLSTESADRYPERLRAIRQGLGQSGYVEGRNMSFEFRSADNQSDRFPALAADLVRRRVSVIAAGGALATRAAKAATTTIPIVFNMGGDPVALGIVASLNRPGNNLTGVTSLNVEVAAKRLELLHELAPAATNIALLVNPTNPTLTEPTTKDVQAAATILGVQLTVLHATNDSDFDAAFATVAQLRAGGLVISSDGFLASRNEQLAALALHYGVPAIGSNRDFAAAGGLMNYGGSVTEAYRLVGVYTGRILKGEGPAELPVQQATKIELVINMKTAKALGITFPITLLGRADEVIE